MLLIIDIYFVMINYECCVILNLQEILTNANLLLIDFKKKNYE